MAVIRSSDLDFDQIKANLKTFLEQQDEFADYDFEASGLSNILDVLAYNTHINGLISNFAINESFLSSAQLRSSVLSHAEALGYYARSKTGSQATVTLSLATTSTTVNTVTIPAYTTFSTSVDNVAYTFRTLESYTASNDGAGNFSFVTSAGSTNIPIYEGTLKTKTFIVGDTTDNQVYVIPDETIDTATLSVKVYDTTTSSSFTSYIDINQTIRINNDTTVYIIRETPNGYYELTFSDGNVLGTSPIAGNKIVIQYLSTAAAAANNAKVFVADNQIGVDGTDYTLNVTTVSNSAGGSEKETIESIRANAPLGFAAQQRLVTAEDYKALILENFSSTVQDVTAWGGNDNVPPIYGRVYVSLNFKDGLSAATQQSVKDQINTRLSDNLSIMSIDTVFTDPEMTYLELDTFFNFDPDLSGDTIQTVQGQVQNLINTYVTGQLNTFDSVFRRSNLLAQIDDLSPAILNSRMNVKLQQRFTPTVNVLSDYSVSFPVQIAQPDDTNYIIESSRFTFGNKTCIIRNQLNSNKLQIFDLLGTVVRDNIGSYNATTGVVQISGFVPSAYEGGYMRISIVPANQSTVRPLRNYIITIDSGRSFSQGIVDYQNTATTLTS